MKTKRNAFFCLCLCLCILFSACGNQPEDPSAPAEESADASEDPNIAAARAYLEELLTEEPFVEDEYIYLLTAERAEAIRACVKTLKVPFLTETDVIRIAERTTAVYVSAWQEGRAVILPACGPLEILQSSTWTFSLYTEHAEANNSLLAYLLYLFTPSDYLFWGSEVRDEVWYEEQLSSTASAAALCLPLAPSAGEYTNRTGALAAMQEGQGYVRLYPLHVLDEGRPLDFSHCGTPELLRGGERRPFDLYAMAGEETPFRRMRAEEVTMVLLDRYTNATGDQFIMWVYDGLSADPSRKCIPFSPEIAQTVREMTALLSSPTLTEEDVRDLLAAFHEDVFYRWYAEDFSVLLPGAEGEEDLLLPEDMTLNQRARRMLAYAIDLFTPPACRFTDLFDRPGAYYALAENAGYVWVTESYELYLVDASGGVTPLYTAWEEDVPA